MHHRPAAMFLLHIAAIRNVAAKLISTPQKRVRKSEPNEFSTPIQPGIQWCTAGGDLRPHFIKVDG
jgi:hypothetical protein